MSGNNILSLILTIIFYLFIGYIAIAFLIGIFPLLAVALLIILAVSAVVSIVNYMRSRLSRAQTRRKFDEFGNRRTKATIVEINETADQSPANKNIPENKE